jgi:hypothetical protein
VTAAPQLWIVEGIRPWSAAGPGWANAGLSLVLRNHRSGEMRTRTIYADAMTREQVRSLRMALAIWDDVRDSFGSAHVPGSELAWFIEWDGEE